MYLDTIALQGRIFLYSVGMGFFLGILFNVWEFIGMFLPKKQIFIIPRDIIFMVLSSFLMFLFSLAVHNGSFKFYVYFGAVAGFIVCFFSLGKFLSRTGERAARILKSFFGKSKRIILSFTDKRRKKRAEKAKKSENSSNLLLQDDKDMLYNNKDINENGSEEQK